MTLLECPECKGECQIEVITNFNARDGEPDGWLEPCPTCEGKGVVESEPEGEDTPFGRQPKPVRVKLYGEKPDVIYWLNELGRRAEFKGDLVQTSDNELGAFTIYPRAVND